MFIHAPVFVYVPLWDADFLLRALGQGRACTLMLVKIYVRHET
jgi:hypothetical protein